MLCAAVVEDQSSMVTAEHETVPPSDGQLSRGTDGPDLSVWNMAGIDFVPLIWGASCMAATRLAENA